MSRNAEDQVRLQVQGSSGSRRAQAGVALVASLILLIVVTLIGLAAVRNTSMQTRMTSNFYDRSIGFQSAEAGLVAGGAALFAGTATIRNCGQGGVACASNPFEDSTLASNNITTVATTTYTAGSNAASQPQYVVENMGSFTDANTDPGFGQTANAAQNGAQGTVVTATYYRITARSGDPSTTSVGQRAVVTLQATYKQ